MWKDVADNHVRILIEHGVKARHRSMLVIVGDKWLDQVVNIYDMLSKSSTRSSPTIWCYKDKDKLGLSRNKKELAEQGKKLIQRGVLDPNRVDQFTRFIERARFLLYRDTEKILGNTYGTCILQDFEALTPNILARTIETVEGGGLVILLLPSLPSLRSLFTMPMDVHKRLQTKYNSKIIPRFNERFVLSLSSCKACLVMDDALNILPISAHAKSMFVSSNAKGTLDMGQELSCLKEQLVDNLLVGPLVGLCATLDQGKAVASFLYAVLSKELLSTIALTASRGRGKSAALGLAIAGAIAAGYSNIFITAPRPQNLGSLFEYVCRGLHMLKYEEHLHYDLLRSNNPEFQRAIVGIDIHKQHKQRVKYIDPHDRSNLSQVQLLVIDEAAAIPLPIIKPLIGPYLVFLSSTVDGYEGTGRSLPLKLLSHLERKSETSTSGNSDNRFESLKLKESIRYASGDPIESWLKNLVCMDATSSEPTISRFSHPSECQLYYVSKDTLFSFRRESEIFLQQMMSLFVASHYKYSPNDLQLMADAPAHHLFVLLGPFDESRNILPDIFCVLQVCLEGLISRDFALKCSHMGRQPSGDQIPWKFCEEFEDMTFPTLSGLRIVRIAVHPSAVGHGYGSAALDLLIRYYEGHLTHITEKDVQTNNDTVLRVKLNHTTEKASLLEEMITPRENLPHMLIHLGDRSPEKIQYIGASFGLTLDLLRFWKKHKFSPFYICDTPNNMTGEHSCMVLRPIESDEIEGSQVGLEGYLSPFYFRFKKRFIGRLALCFREMDCELAMSILDSKINLSSGDPLVSSESNSTLMKLIISSANLEMLEDCTKSYEDYGKVKHMVPRLAWCYFMGKLPITLSHLQASIFLSMGLQRHDIAHIEGKMNIERQQILSLFRKVMVKIYNYLYDVLTNEFKASPSKEPETEFQPHSILLDDDLDDGAKQVMGKMNSDRVGLLDSKSKSLQQHSVADGEADFEHALRSCTTISRDGLLGVRSKSMSKKAGKKRKIQRE